MSGAATPLLLAGTLLQGASSLYQANLQGSILRQQAGVERRLAAEREDDFRHRQSRAMAARRAALGAAGVDPSTGSPLLASEDFASEVELMARRIRAGGDVRATRLEQQALLNQFAGRSEFVGSALRAGSLLLNGSGRSFS